MKIKIKDPALISLNHTLIHTGTLFSVFLLLACAAMLYLKITPMQLWDTLGILINDTCGNDTKCRLLCIFLFKICPFVLLICSIGLWRDIKKQRKVSKSNVQYITFNQDGVLLKKVHAKQEILFPYKQTALKLIITAWKAPTPARTASANAISGIEFVFSTPEETISVEHFPSKPQAFLCTLLDARGPFKEFSYLVKPLNPWDQDAATQIQALLDNYRNTGFFSYFASPQVRLCTLYVSAIILSVGIYFLFCFTMPLSLIGGLPPLALGAFYLWRALFDIYKEKKAKRKYKK